MYTKGEISSKDVYYKAIIQLRTKDEEVLKKTYNLILKGPCLISKKDTIKHGYNLQLTSKKFAKEIAKKLQKKFKGEVKESHTLYGINRVTSKRVSRLTVLFRKTL